VIFLDIGTSFIPGFEKICRYLNNILILVEPQLTTVKRTKIMVEQLESANISSGKSIDLVLYNRVRADIQMNTIQVTEEMEGMPVAIMIPPAPELANQAAQTHKPMIDVQPDGLVSQQFTRMAEILQERISRNQ
jgi:Flp pilus assembly CpaE family ATPase